MSDNVIAFTDSNFEAEVLKSDRPVLVDFTAEWCPPCKVLAPMIDRLAGEYAGRAKVGKLDADENRDTLVKYGVSALPTVIVFRNGEVVGKFQGLRKESDYREVLDQR